MVTVFSLIIKQILHSSKGELSHTLSYEATSHDQTRVRVNIFTEGKKAVLQLHMSGTR